MKLRVFLDNRSHDINIDDADIEYGQPMFDKMDADMDKGWKIGMEFVENPDQTQRAQVAASRLMVAMETGQEAMITAMAGYILSRLPNCTGVIVDMEGDPLNTQFLFD